MSNTPLTIGEDIMPEVLGQAGWTNAELIWEQIQQAAAECDALGNSDKAADLWEGALTVAREQLPANDARLATSLINFGVARQRGGHEATAMAMFREALEVWEAAVAWVADLRAEARARSSTFHFRLEAKHPGGYAHFSHRRYKALHAEGEAAIAAHLQGQAQSSDRLGRWGRERPHAFNDMRKLLGAVLLMA